MAKLTVPDFTGKEKKIYDLLMLVREQVTGQMKRHAEDALDCSNADKRGVTTHMADMGVDSSIHEMELRLMTEDGNILALIEDAIKRLINGEYGKCIDCGGDIPEGRLLVRPYAIYCVGCKSKREQQF